MKWTVYIVVVFLSIFMVNAIEMNDACASRAYEYTVGSFEYNSEWIPIDNAYVNVIGDARKINWTSSENIDAVVYKSGTRSYLSDGGLNGSIPKTTLSNDFVWIVFCRNETIENIIDNTTNNINSSIDDVANNTTGDITNNTTETTDNTNNGSDNSTTENTDSTGTDGTDNTDNSNDNTSDNTGYEDDASQVPEFGIMGIILAMIGGIFIFGHKIYKL